MRNSVYNYDHYNYWEMYPEELPSRGIFYNKNARIKVRTMSVLEVKFLATYKEQTATRICNEIINKCTILENLKIEDLLLPDRDYIIFWIRLNTFNTSNGFTINIPHCSTCESPISTEISLNDITDRYLDNGFVPEVHLPDLNTTIPVKIPKYGDSIYNVENELEDIALRIDTDNTFDDKIRFVSSLTALDYIHLKDHIKYYGCGINDEIIVPCKICGTQHNVKMIINDTNIFTKIELRDILEKITRIAKYSNLTITNDWSWVEVELEQQIINEMIREENQETQHQIQGVSSKIPAATGNGGMPNMPSMPGLPSLPHL